MRLIKSYYKILSKIDGIEMLKNIEIAGRICYKSEDKITENSSTEFVKRLILSGHESVLEHQSFSVKLVVDRGVSHEIVRHRIASFSQESTRYCNYGKDEHITFIIPCWFKGEDKESIGKEIGGPTWYYSMEQVEEDYNFLVKECNWKPQQARSILPNSLKTEIVVTANLREWRTIFKQRTAKAAHPQMREIMCPLLSELKQIIPVIFDDIKGE